jgi:hypothetical protein
MPPAATAPLPLRNPAAEVRTICPEELTLKLADTIAGALPGPAPGSIRITFGLDGGAMRWEGPSAGWSDADI